MSLFTELKRRNVIRVAIAYVAFAWLIIQVVETLFPVYGLTEEHIRIVVALLAIGLPLVLVFSWLYELTPEGLKLDRDVDRSTSIAGQTGKKLDRVIIAVLALAVGFFAVDKFVLDPARDAEREAAVAEQARSDAIIEAYGASSIAVLPFENMSADPNDEFFSDGISEELLNLLSRIPELRVISRSSSFALKGKELTVPEIAERLNVALVLEGSVRRFADDLRITAQLIDARSDTHLWSETYDRKMENLFAVQDEISAAIVVALRSKLGASVESVPAVTSTTTVDAYDAYLRGRYLLEQRTPASKRAAVQEFERAIELDAGYAPAHAEFAIAVAIGGLGRGVSAEERLSAMKQHALMALQIDPKLAEAHAAIGLMLELEDREAEALAAFRRAVELNPSYAIVYVWMTRYVSDLDEGFRMQTEALRLDPLSRSANFGYINGLIRRNRLEEAARAIDRFASIEPAGATILRGELTSIGGNWSEWMLAYLEAASVSPGNLVFGGGLGFAFNWRLGTIGLRNEALKRGEGYPQFQAWFGDPEVGVAEAQAMFGSADGLHANLVLGLVLAHAGYYDRAAPYLERYWTISGEAFDVGDPTAIQALEAIVFIRRRAGDDAGAARAIDAMFETVGRARAAGLTLTRIDLSVDFEEGIAAWLAGDRETGLTLIGKAVDDGYWIPPMSAFQRARFEDPGFSTIYERNKAREARERGKVLAVVCDDNPYADVWEPMAETCEESWIK